ncbi:MAG: hypothetical protein LBU27_05095 [Candidatus Peribacteria bacterium]|jgi:hypothetical protein|nr:hypothetical protein [Candidatus Peribacteria bacterium]
MIATANAALVDDAIARAYTKGLTRYTTNDEFGINRSIRRDEAAKFFVQFSNIIGQTNYVKDINQCQFSDVNNAISDLKETIIESCRLGIFNGANGKFYPAGNLTNAEAVAVLIRILYGRLPEISGPIWAINYYNKAEKLGAFVNIDMKEEKNIAGTRGNIIKMMYSVREMRGKGEENIRDINK